MKKGTGYLAFVLMLSEVLLVLLSWLLSATTGGDVHSLLSSEGIRHLFGGFVAMLQKPLLVWMLLLAMAWGILHDSGIICRSPQRQPLMMVAGLLVLYVAVVALLTLTPHAVLLSATGGLWSSPFSRFLVPMVAFGIILMAVAYGLLSRRFLSFSDIMQSLSGGVAQWAPLFLLYVLFMQLYGSLLFVFR